MVDGHFEIRIADDAHGANNLCCPYCSNSFNSTLNHDRHIMMRPACQTHRLKALVEERHGRRQRQYKIAGPSSRPLPKARSPGPSTRTDAGGLRYNKPRSWRWDDHGRTCGKAYVERFQFSSAGQPISRHRTHPVDLGRYLREIGGLADPEVMVAAEQMMTEGLSCCTRDCFLKSSFYKGKVPWRDSRMLLADIDKPRHGPSWTAEELIAGEGQYERVHVVYKRSVIDVIHDLIGNPRFRDVMRYAPE
ncbi:hypothetical protein BDV93DRAFT_556344 [Ceratobasidium sp. AG-I]|nr:hypothetical protein BDV93DRAFT_556344 [Ceratobasidium sp. AG-I]